MGQSVAYAVTAASAQAGGGAIHVAVASVMAGIETKHVRHKEHKYKKSRGLTGLSRGRANKEVSQAWAGAGAGSAGSIGIGLGVIYGAVCLST